MLGEGLMGGLWKDLLGNLTGGKETAEEVDPTQAWLDRDTGYTAGNLPVGQAAAVTEGEKGSPMDYEKINKILNKLGVNTMNQSMEEAGGHATSGHIPIFDKGGARTYDPEYSKWDVRTVYDTYQGKYDHLLEEESVPGEGDNKFFKNKGKGLAKALGLMGAAYALHKNRDTIGKGIKSLPFDKNTAFGQLIKSFQKKDIDIKTGSLLNNPSGNRDIGDIVADVEKINNPDSGPIPQPNLFDEEGFGGAGAIDPLANGLVGWQKGK